MCVSAVCVCVCVYQLCVCVCVCVCVYQLCVCVCVCVCVCISCVCGEFNALFEDHRCCMPIHDRSDFIHAFYLEGWVEDLKVLRYHHHLCLHVQQLQVEIQYYTKLASRPKLCIVLIIMIHYACIESERFEP